MRSAKKTTHGRTYRALAGIVRMGFDRNLALGALPRHFAAKDSRKGLSLVLSHARRTCALITYFDSLDVPLLRTLDRSVGKFDRT